MVVVIGSGSELFEEQINSLVRDYSSSERGYSYYTECIKRFKSQFLAS